MIKKNYNKYNRIPLFCLAVLFMLTIFVFTDFGIRLIFGFALLVFLALFSIVVESQESSLRVSNFGVAYVLLALFISLFVVMPGSRMAYDVFAMMISLDVSALFVIGAHPSRLEIAKALKLVVAFALLLSAYVVLVTMIPSVYYNIVCRYITAESARVGTTLLSQGYGVCIGGNVVLIDYIVLLAALIVINKYVITGRSVKDLILAFGVAFAFLIVMVLENRKSELLAAVIAVFCCFISRLNFTTAIRKRRNRRLLILGMGFFVLAFAALAGTGKLDRYIYFIENFSVAGLFGSSSAIEITSGRIGLWRTAWELFVEKPITGIGWARFADHVTVHNDIINSTLENVHNNYLQVLCETGIIGFILIIVPFLYLFYRTIKAGKRLKKYGSEAYLARIINSVAWGFQLFNLIVSFIDPSWYKISFWWFFAVVIIMAQASDRMEKELSLQMNNTE